MPLYEYICAKCKSGQEAMRTVEAREIAPECFFCKVPMALIVSPVAGIVKNPAVPRRPK